MSTPDETFYRGEPSLTGHSFIANDWSTDDDNGADWELIVDEWQYIFQDHDGELSFTGLWDPSDDFYAHPEIQERTVPNEIADLFVGAAIQPLADGVPIEDADPIEIQGHVQAENGTDMLLVENPQNPEQGWKNAESVIREICSGLGQLERDCGTKMYPATTVEGNDKSLLVSFESSGVNHVYRFDRDRDGGTLYPAEMVQQGESYRMFEVPEFVKRIVGAHGYEIGND